MSMYKNISKDRKLLDEEENKGSSLRLTHEQSIFFYFNISSDFFSLSLNFYAPLNLD